MSPLLQTLKRMFFITCYYVHQQEEAKYRIGPGVKYEKIPNDVSVTPPRFATSTPKIKTVFTHDPVDAHRLSLGRLRLKPQNGIHDFTARSSAEYIIVRSLQTRTIVQKSHNPHNSHLNLTSIRSQPEN